MLYDTWATRAVFFRRPRFTPCVQHAEAAASAVLLVYISLSGDAWPKFALPAVFPPKTARRVRSGNGQPCLAQLCLRRSGYAAIYSFFFDGLWTKRGSGMNPLPGFVADARTPHGMRRFKSADEPSAWIGVDAAHNPHKLLPFKPTRCSHFNSAIARGMTPSPMTQLATLAHRDSSCQSSL